MARPRPGYRYWDGGTDGGALPSGAGFAGVGAATGAIAGGGKNAGKGAGVDGVVGLAAGTLFGLISGNGTFTTGA